MEEDLSGEDFESLVGMLENFAVVMMVVVREGVTG